ncbi:MULTISPECIES: hydroxylamine reductase [unclassified Methanoculleus]|jgi:hydroxylamine reductase|uniref:hydroxylamine reductase n=1 Tax=unclassified Methanoculleus TaxID=2619537 RepID=UPI0025EEB178|nr:hydroxylamine reductase [Methanoculleus sp. UBA377]MDD2473984.1 hydroxylamine reductase [Methanoculleus sp.]
MFCNQCEETAKGLGCTVRGVCGKDGETAGLQDVLIYLLKGVSVRNLAAAEKGGGDPEAGRFIAECLFATLTNVNFDPARFRDAVREAVRIRDALPPSGSGEPDACTWAPGSPTAIAAKAQEIAAARETVNVDLQSLRELLVYGLKGVAAYSHHAAVLGYDDEEVTTFMQKGLAATLQDHTVEEMVGYVLACGKIGVKVLALLDTANTAVYGTPAITKVGTAAGTRPGILVTGHDLKDLADLLEQTVGTGVDIYTHGEMLPAHAYPEFRKYNHLVGNYGGSWPFQREEFERFNGPVLVTTNCLVPPKDSYRDRVYTTGPVGYPGLTHIGASPDGKKDFSALIEHAKRCNPPEDLSRGDLVTGCAHAPVLTIADTVVGAVKSGAVRRFVVMAGCDGRHGERDYYTRFAEALPADTVILTAGCAKYRYNSLGFGDIGGIPRVLDAGQCNDCYSLVVIAKALAEAFGVGINELPISYNIAWYEQKAVLVLLALLSLGVRDITLGPRLPAFVSPGILKVLVENFGVRGIATVEEDLPGMVPGN